MKCIEHMLREVSKISVFVSRCPEPATRDQATFIHAASAIAKRFSTFFFLVHFKCSLITSLNTRNSSWLFMSVCWESSSSTAHHLTIIFQSRTSRWTRKTTIFYFLSAAASWSDCVDPWDEVERRFNVCIIFEMHIFNGFHWRGRGNMNLNIWNFLDKKKKISLEL